MNDGSQTAGRRICARPLLLAMTVLLLAHGCSKREPAAARAGSSAEPPNGPTGTVWVFHAASLSLPFAELEERFEERFPGSDVIRESSSSRMAIRKVTELNRRADLVASADDILLRELMVPDHATWVTQFARNRIVIAYTNRSKYRAEINPDNWYDILLRPDVNFGYCNPDMAPVGYRTLLCWQLADLHYAQSLGGRRVSEELLKRCPDKNVRPHCNELIPLLESLSLDYTFQYRSVALQHRLEWLKLPDEIDLGNENLAGTYAKAQAKISGHTRASAITRTGKPIVYGLTIPADAGNTVGAEAFVQLLLSPEGQHVMEVQFQEPIDPPVCHGWSTAPASLKPLLREAQP